MGDLRKRKGEYELRVAVTSTNGKDIDLHFGDAKSFLIFEVKDGSSEFLEIREKTDLPIENHTDRWIESLEILKDCKAVICSKIGKEPSIELRKSGIRPIQLDISVKDALKECSNHTI